MPKMEYHCSDCDHDFERVIMQGEQSRIAVCPKCRGTQSKPVKSSHSLFKGIASFSSLAGDKN